MTDHDDRPTCPECEGPVDSDGDTTTGCPVDRDPENYCTGCGACFCDGSC